MPEARGSQPHILALDIMLGRSELAHAQSLP
jgi:hypothetical protein